MRQDAPLSPPCAHLCAPEHVGLIIRCGQTLMADCYLEAAKNDIDTQKAGLKSEAQSVSCFLKDTCHNFYLN